MKKYVQDLNSSLIVYSYCANLVINRNFSLSTQGINRISSQLM